MNDMNDILTGRRIRITKPPVDGTPQTIEGLVVACVFPTIGDEVLRVKVMLHLNTGAVGYQGLDSRSQLEFLEEPSDELKAARERIAELEKESLGWLTTANIKQTEIDAIAAQRNEANDRIAELEAVVRRLRDAELGDARVLRVVLDELYALVPEVGA